MGRRACRGPPDGRCRLARRRQLPAPLPPNAGCPTLHKALLAHPLHFPAPSYRFAAGRESTHGAAVLTASPICADLAPSYTCRLSTWQSSLPASRLPLQPARAPLPGATSAATSTTT